VREGEFFGVEVLQEAVQRAKDNDGCVHLMGLASDAGVHARLEHLYGCIELCKRMGHDKVAIHCFTDGRDTGPYTGRDFIAQIEAKCAEIGVGKVVSICGRYYAMDRDNRWERVKMAYDLLTGRGEALPNFATAGEAMQDYYDNPTNDSQNGDEFVTPRTVGGDHADTRIGDGDSVIFYNYRGDRPREISRAFVMSDFYGNVPPSPDSGEKGFDRGRQLDVFYVTMTAYEQELNEIVSGVAFPKPPKMDDIAGQWLAQKGLNQFRCAETEKFPHVTFFFNDYRDDPFDGEDRKIVQSPKVATYDLQPEMSAPGVCDAVLEALDGDYALIVVNFANGDMVGHTGKLDAAVKAIEAVDEYVGKIVDKTLAKGGSLIVTADHGNAEQMFNPETDAPHTAHTTYDVECVVVDERITGESKVELRGDGRLADVVPTAFALMGLSKPEAMTGQSLVPIALSPARESSGSGDAPSDEGGDTDSDDPDPVATSSDPPTPESKPATEIAQRPVAEPEPERETRAAGRVVPSTEPAAVIATTPKPSPTAEPEAAAAPPRVATPRPTPLTQSPPRGQAARTSARVERCRPTVPQGTLTRVSTPGVIRMSQATDQFKPGAVVEVTQQIPHRDDDVWTTKVIGTVIKYEQAKTGSWYAHAKDDKLWLDRLTLRKDDGEIVVLILDKYTHVERLEADAAD